ncbi:MAG: N-acetyltransferase [Bacteroidetes bacterium]|nr:MAG: N-acetyltransferase [Bacteroidota bacterium]
MQESIRPYQSTDREQLLELLRLNTPTYFAPEEEADFIEYLEQHLEEYFVVEGAGKIVGCGGINYLKNNTEARISWDMIHPDFQGKGLGSRLTRHRIDCILEHPKVRVIVVRTTQLVYPFYQKSGFVLIKTEPDYWAPGFDLYHMEWKVR